MKGEVRRAEQNVQKYRWGIPGKQGEKQLGNRKHKCPSFGAWEPRARGGGQIGKDANVPLVTLLFRVWILGVLKAYSSPV